MDDAQQLPLCEINNTILRRWEKLLPKHVVKGDHVKSSTLGVPHSIVVKRHPANGTLELIGCFPDGEWSKIQRHTIVLHANQSLDKAVYSTEYHKIDDNIGRAIGKLETTKPRDHVYHDGSFAMWCMTGLSIHWKPRLINELIPGLHIQFDSPRRHGILERKDLERGQLHTIIFDAETREVKRYVHSGKSKDRYECAIYNVCCDEKTSLSLARKLMGQTDEKLSFGSEVEFAVSCRRGRTDVITKLPEAVAIQYPPRSRIYNTRVLTAWTKMNSSQLTKGNHVKHIEGKDLKVSHVIVEEVQDGGGRLLVIGCIGEGDDTSIKRETIVLEKSREVEVAQYCSSNNSAVVVKKAKQLMKQYKNSIFEGSALHFAMLCQRGTWSCWEDVCINQLVPADHIEMQHGHAIVETVDAPASTFTCIKYNTHLRSKSKIEIVTKTGELQMKRAVYNSSFDQEDVLRLARSRLYETDFHLLYNNSETFAKWCKFGIAGNRITHKELIISSSMLKPGDQISWTRVLGYDHHAVIEEVKGPNLIVVYEFTVNPNSERKGKTIKRQTELPIFDGEDPPYKVTHTPAVDPEIFLQEVASQVGQEGDYNPVSNSCEDYATKGEEFKSQAKGFFKFLAELLSKGGSKLTTTQLAGLIEDGVRYSVAKYLTTFGTTVVSDAKSSIHHGLCHCAKALHSTGFFVPIFIECGMILWDINYDWKNHKKIRVFVGLIGTVVTSLVLTLIAIPTVSIGLSIGLAILGVILGILGTAATNFAMRSARRITDRTACRTAFAGHYEHLPKKPSLVDKIKAFFVRIYEILKAYALKFAELFNLNQVFKSVQLQD